MIKSDIAFYAMFLIVAMMIPHAAYGMDPITEIKMLTSEGITHHVDYSKIIAQIEHAQSIAIKHAKIEQLNATYQYGNMTIPNVTLPINETSQICTPTLNGTHAISISCINGENDTQ